MGSCRRERASNETKQRVLFVVGVVTRAEVRFTWSGELRLL